MEVAKDFKEWLDWVDNNENFSAARIKSWVEASQDYVGAFIKGNSKLAKRLTAFLNKLSKYIIETPNSDSVVNQALLSLSTLFKNCGKVSQMTSKMQDLLIEGIGIIEAHFDNESKKYTYRYGSEGYRAQEDKNKEFENQEKTLIGRIKDIVEHPQSVKKIAKILNRISNGGKLKPKEIKILQSDSVDFYDAFGNWIYTDIPEASVRGALVDAGVLQPVQQQNATVNQPAADAEGIAAEQQEREIEEQKRRVEENNEEIKRKEQDVDGIMEAVSDLHEVLRTAAQGSHSLADLAEDGDNIAAKGGEMPTEQLTESEQEEFDVAATVPNDNMPQPQPVKEKQPVPAVKGGKKKKANAKAKQPTTPNKDQNAVAALQGTRRKAKSSQQERTEQDRKKKANRQAKLKAVAGGIRRNAKAAAEAQARVQEEIDAGERNPDGSKVGETPRSEVIEHAKQLAIASPKEVGHGKEINQIVAEGGAVTQDGVVILNPRSTAESGKRPQQPALTVEDGRKELEVICNDIVALATKGGNVNDWKGIHNRLNAVRTITLRSIESSQERTDFATYVDVIFGIVKRRVSENRNSKGKTLAEADALEAATQFIIARNQPPEIENAEEEQPILGLAPGLKDAQPENNTEANDSMKSSSGESGNNIGESIKIFMNNYSEELNTIEDICHPLYESLINILEILNNMELAYRAESGNEERTLLRLLDSLNLEDREKEKPFISAFRNPYDVTLGVVEQELNGLGEFLISDVQPVIGVLNQKETREEMSALLCKLLDSIHEGYNIEYKYANKEKDKEYQKAKKANEKEQRSLRKQIERLKRIAQRQQSNSEPKKKENDRILEYERLLSSGIKTIKKNKDVPGYVEAIVRGLKSNQAKIKGEIAGIEESLRGAELTPEQQEAAQGRLKRLKALDKRYDDAISTYSPRPVSADQPKAKNTEENVAKQSKKSPRERGVSVASAIGNFFKGAGRKIKSLFEGIGGKNKDAEASAAKPKKEKKVKEPKPKKEKKSPTDKNKSATKSVSEQAEAAKPKKEKKSKLDRQIEKLEKKLKSLESTHYGIGVNNGGKATTVREELNKLYELRGDRVPTQASKDTPADTEAEEIKVTDADGVAKKKSGFDKLYEAILARAAAKRGKPEIGDSESLVDEAFDDFDWKEIATRAKRGDNIYEDILIGALSRNLEGTTVDNDMLDAFREIAFNDNGNINPRLIRNPNPSVPPAAQRHFNPFRDELETRLTPDADELDEIITNDVLEAQAASVNMADELTQEAVQAAQQQFAAEKEAERLAAEQQARQDAQDAQIVSDANAALGGQQPQDNSVQPVAAQQGGNNGQAAAAQQPDAQTQQGDAQQVINPQPQVSEQSAAAQQPQVVTPAQPGQQVPPAQQGNVPPTAQQPGVQQAEGNLHHLIDILPIEGEKGSRSMNLTTFESNLVNIAGNSPKGQEYATQVKDNLFAQAGAKYDEYCEEKAGTDMIRSTTSALQGMDDLAALNSEYYSRFANTMANCVEFLIDNIKNGRELNQYDYVTIAHLQIMNGSGSQKFMDAFKAVLEAREIDLSQVAQLMNPQGKAVGQIQNAIRQTAVLNQKEQAQDQNNVQNQKTESEDEVEQQPVAQSPKAERKEEDIRQIFHFVFQLPGNNARNTNDSQSEQNSNKSKLESGEDAYRCFITAASNKAALEAKKNGEGLTDEEQYNLECCTRALEQVYRFVMNLENRNSFIAQTVLNEQLDDELADMSNYKRMAYMQAVAIAGAMAALQTNKDKELNDNDLQGIMSITGNYNPKEINRTLGRYKIAYDRIKSGEFNTVIIAEKNKPSRPHC